MFYGSSAGLKPMAPTGATDEFIYECVNVMSGGTISSDSFVLHNTRQDLSLNTHSHVPIQSLRVVELDTRMACAVIERN
jgi:hypothetical protein